MNEVDNSKGLTDRMKEWNGWKFVIALLVIAAGILGVVAYTDGSDYTMNAERINKKFLTIVFSVIAAAVAVGLMFFTNKAKKKRRASK
jgi:membrane protein DedA with SNARE-associated domain